MSTTMTLERAFQNWKNNHGKTAEQLATYLGTTVEKLLALQTEPIPAERKGGFRLEGTGEYDGPLTPAPGAIEDLAKQYDVNPDRIYDVFMGRQKTAGNI